MADVRKKWSVTYTKHVKQKRKVYQDGFLELHSSKNKVILYDDCEMILESRFLKKDDAIVSGEMLAFESYLVDIGDLQGDFKAIPEVNICPKDPKVNGTYESFQSPKFERKPNLGLRKARSINISPSRKVIREFKKSEMTKYGSSPGCPETTKSSKIEWHVLYTTQVTQRAKKYHDGFLQLITCGSQRKQVVLYDETRRPLESRFLKKDEIIRSGESIAFDGHLVDIGECEEDRKPPINFNIQGRMCNMIVKKEATAGQIHSLNQFHIGECQKDVVPKEQMNSKSSIHENNTSALEVGKSPVRAAHEILSILRKTKTEMDVATMKSSSAEGFHASQSSSFFQSDSRYQRKEHLKHVGNEGSTIVELDKQNGMMQKDYIEISKDEAMNEVLSVEVSQSSIKGPETACGFFVGSGATNISIHMVDIDYTESNRRHPGAPALETKCLATLEVDSKESIASVFQDASTGDLKNGNCSEHVSCKENPTGATVSGSDTSQLSVEIDQEKSCPYGEGIDTGWQDGVHVIGEATSSDGTPHEVAGDQNISEQEKSTKKTDEFPSFDLGF